MPQIETPPNFDFQHDQHKLLLIEDLNRLAKAAERLDQRFVALEEEASAAPVYASQCTPFSGTPILVTGSKLSAACGWVSSEGANLGGEVTYTAGGGTPNSNSGAALTYYSLTGDSHVRFAYNMAFSGGTGVKSLVYRARTNLPAGITGWTPSGIEFDFNLSWILGGGETVTVAFQVQYDNGYTQSDSYSYTDGGAGGVHTPGFTTLRVVPGLEGARSTPGTGLDVTVAFSFPGTFNTGQAWIGQLRLNWK